jgi:hypothetical protein
VLQADGVLSDEDGTLILQALFDIRRELRRIRAALLEEDDGEQGDEEEDS